MLNNLFINIYYSWSCRCTWPSLSWRNFWLRTW